MNTVKPELTTIVLPESPRVTNQVMTIFISSAAHAYLSQIEPFPLACSTALDRGLRADPPPADMQFGIRGTRPVVIVVSSEQYTQAVAYGNRAFGGNTRMALGWAITAGSEQVSKQEFIRPIVITRNITVPEKKVRVRVKAQSTPRKQKPEYAGVIPSSAEVAEKRKQLNLTQRQASELTKIARGCISDAETGRRLVPNVMHSLIAAYEQLLQTTDI